MLSRRHAAHSSSIFTSTPAIILTGVMALISALYSSVLIFSALSSLFLIGLVSRIWTYSSSKNISLKMDTRSLYLFAENNCHLNIEIENNKFLPTSYLNLFMPLSKNLSITPERTRKPDQWEIIPLAAKNYSTTEVGEAKLGRLRWYEKKEITLHFKTNRRGVSKLEDWSIRTGDGLGLSETEIRINNGGAITVYPRIISVNTAIFFRNLWNSETGSYGVMEDLSVIKSTREYQTGDSLKHINWRLLARALPLSINTYEDILPKTVHLIFDGESFSGPRTHKKEMEECISIIASILLSLKKRQVDCYFSICKGEESKGRTIRPKDGIREALYTLSVYEPLAEKLNDAGTEIVKQKAQFDITSILSTKPKVGRFYYFSYDAVSMDENIARNISREELCIFSYLDTRKRRIHGNLNIESLIAGGRHE